MRWWRVAVVPVVLTGVLFGAAPAYGHVALVSSDPADGARLDAPPNRVILVFSEPVNPKLSRVALTIAQTPTPLPSPVRILDDTITVPLPAGSGGYRLVYRVIGTDGHRIDGRVQFTVAGTASDRPTPTATTDSAPATLDSGGSSARAVPADRGDSAPWWPAVLGAFLLAGALAYVLTIGRNRGKEASSSVGTTSEPHSRGDQSGDQHLRD